MRCTISKRFTITAIALTGVAVVAIGSSAMKAKEGTDAANKVLTASQIYSAEPTTPADLGYNDPAKLEAAITTFYNEEWAKKPSLKGLTVAQVICVSSGEHLFDCSTTTSDPDVHTLDTFVVAADGQSYVAKAPTVALP